jgi:hypothetical protein
MVHAIRSLRVLLFGLVTLEAAGGFGLPQSVDETLTRLIGGLHLSFLELWGGQTAAGKQRESRHINAFGIREQGLRD